MSPAIRRVSTFFFWHYQYQRLLKKSCCLHPQCHLSWQAPSSLPKTEQTLGVKLTLPNTSRIYKY